MYTSSVINAIYPDKGSSVMKPNQKALVFPLSRIYPSQHRRLIL